LSDLTSSSSSYYYYYYYYYHHHHHLQIWSVSSKVLPATSRFCTIVGDFSGDKPVGIGGLVQFAASMAWRKILSGGWVVGGGRRKRGSGSGGGGGGGGGGHVFLIVVGLFHHVSENLALGVHGGVIYRLL